MEEVKWICFFGSVGFMLIDYVNRDVVHTDFSGVSYLPNFIGL